MAFRLFEFPEAECAAQRAVKCVGVHGFNPIDLRGKRYDRDPANHPFFTSRSPSSMRGGGVSGHWFAATALPFHAGVQAQLSEGRRATIRAAQGCDVRREFLRYLVETPLRWLGVVVLAAVIFVADTVTDLEIALAVLYIAVILISVRSGRPRAVIAVGIGSTVLTVSSYLLTPHGDPESGIVNCALSLLAIGATIYLRAFSAFHFRFAADPLRPLVGTIGFKQSATDMGRTLLSTLLGIRVLARTRPEKDLLEGLVKPVLALATGLGCESFQGAGLVVERRMIFGRQ
jgi:hypothetical protein